MKVTVARRWCCCCRLRRKSAGERFAGGEEEQHPPPFTARENFLSIGISSAFVKSLISPTSLDSLIWKPPEKAVRFLLDSHLQNLTGEDSKSLSANPNPTAVAAWLGGGKSGGKSGAIQGGKSNGSGSMAWWSAAAAWWSSGDRQRQQRVEEEDEQ
ncbi:hypothetical protein Dimus_032660 [Dionaea muscipula]